MGHRRGIVVEGPSDEKVVRKIAARLKIPIEVRIARGKSELLKRMDSYALLLRDCRKVIALIDSHCTEVSKVEEKIKSLRRTPKREVKICVVKHAIEAWFLADINTLQRFLGGKIKSISNPEEICKPEEEIDRLYKNSGKEYLKTVYAPELTEGINFKVVERKCESFRNFVKLLKNC